MTHRLSHCAEEMFRFVDGGIDLSGVWDLPGCFFFLMWRTPTS